MAGRVQVAISADGTEIVGRVRGQAASVLVHGGWGDGEVAYEALVPTRPVHLLHAEHTRPRPVRRQPGPLGAPPDTGCHRVHRHNR